MEEVQYHHHHHHHHHGHNSGYDNQGQQNAATLNAAATSVVVEQQNQQTLSVPVGGIQTAGSFHSVSSLDSSAEMAKYFPDAQTPGLSSMRYQQGAEGQIQSTAASNTVVTTNTNTVNAGPYIPVSAPTAVQQVSHPVRPPFMAQQQQQRPVRPPGQPQRPTGISSYPSQIEGLSVSQAVVNDVLVDLQTKVLNESLQQYQDEVSSGNFLEPIPPIYIRAPQPTVILRSDLNRLRAELNSRARPPVVYRHPAGPNQYQQQHFQQNVFQAPRFPPPQQYAPQDSYGQYQNPIFATSNEYSPTTEDEHRKEREERLYNQAEPPIFNDDSINGNVQTAFDLQGLSTTSFDRYASPYQSSSFLPNLEDQQQGNEETVFPSSQHINHEEVGSTDNMFSKPLLSRQEVTFDINNCIYRCFEAHRQRVARRRAARQARRARRQKQIGQQQQYLPLYDVNQYQHFSTHPSYSSFGTVEQTAWEQQSPLVSSTQYSDTISGLKGTYDYTNVPEASSLPTDIQQYQSSDIVNTHTSQIPFSSLSTSNIDATVPVDVQSSENNYYQYNTLDTQDAHLSSNPYDYTTGQTGLSSTDYIQQSAVQQQQQAPSQFVQDQGIYTHTSNTFDYPQETTQAHLSNYDYHSTEQQQAYQYPYNVDTTQQEQKQTSDYANQTISSSDYYQPQAASTSESQTQAAYSQSTGTLEYTRESYQSEEPIYNYQNADHQTSQYSYNGGDTQQVPQQDAYNYASTSQTLDSSTQDLSSTDYYQQQQSTGSFDYTGSTLQTQIPTYNYQNIEQQSYQYPYNTSNVEQQTYNYASGTNIDAFVPTEANIQHTDQNQAYNYSDQGFDTSNYYQQQLAPTSTSQIQGAYGQPTGTFEYSRESYQSQQPIYAYQGSDQQSSQSQDRYDYTPQPVTLQQTGQNQTYDYSQQIIGSADQYQQQSVSIPVSQTDHSRAFGQRLPSGSIPTGTVEYTRQSYYSQEPVLDNYSTETFIQQQENQSLNVNDYLTRFGSELSSQSTGGPTQSSDDRQSTTTVTTTPFIIQQQHANLTSPEGAIQTYDLQNYTNESTVSETIQPLPFTSSPYEEDHQRLLQQSEQYTEKEVTLDDTYSSLPPPPPTTEATVHQQGAYLTNVSDFPPPPDHHTYQTGHTQAPIIPSTLSSDQQTDDDTQEDEEVFDLHQCIAKCYAKYQQSWNQEEQRKYEEQIRNIPPSVPTTDYHQPSLNTGERLSQNVITQSDTVQYKYDDISTKDLPIDSRSQQTIEYSPPLITQAKPTITTIPPSVPSSSYSYIQGEQQQQQIPVYDHASPVPPHLSFNDTNYQPNLYFSSQITAQPRQHQNIPIDTDEQQRRHRAHSEPASIKQDSVTSIPPIQPPPPQVFEDQTRRAISIPMLNQAPIHLLDNGRAYETEAMLERRVPRIDPKTGLCLVPCPMARKYAHLPPHLRPELFCIELPPPSALPPVPPPPPPRPVQQQQQRWCVRCCCVPGQSLVKKVVYRQAEEEQQQEESGYDYTSVIDQMATRINVRYGNNIMEEGDAFVSGNYNEQLRVIDFPVYVSGQNDPTLTPLVPVN